MSAARHYIVAYDVASPKRWRRLQKLVRRVGERRQLSVFLCRMTPNRRDRLERELRQVLHPEDDRLLIVETPSLASGANLEPLVL